MVGHNRRNGPYWLEKIAKRHYFQDCLKGLLWYYLMFDESGIWKCKWWYILYILTKKMLTWHWTCNLTNISLCQKHFNELAQKT